jgi:two-component system sensor histidine kinase ChvG
VIDHDVLRIDRLVNDISTASKLDSDFLKDQESKFELVADLSEKSIKVVGLEDRLAQVIMNLITNAISFCGAGDAIRIWVRQCDNRVLIVVEDTGPGLSDGSLQKYLTGFTLIGPPAILAITQVLGLLFPNRLSTLTVG